MTKHMILLFSRDLSQTKHQHSTALWDDQLVGMPIGNWILKFINEYCSAARSAVQQTKSNFNRASELQRKFEAGVQFSNCFLRLFLQLVLLWITIQITSRHPTKVRKFSEHSQQHLFGQACIGSMERPQLFEVVRDGINCRLVNPIAVDEQSL